MKNNVRAGCLALILMILLIPALSLWANADALSSDLRYGTGDERDTVLTADALFDLLFPEETPLTAAERAYLCGESAFSFRYRSDIPDATVATDYNSEEGTLTVSVLAYSYCAENGKTVVWTPKTVRMDGEDPLDLTRDGERYVAVYRDIWYSDTFDLTVTFAFQTEISSGLSDALLTETATVAAQALETRRAYETEKAAYDEQKSAYDAYIADKAAYDEQKSAYDAYVAEKTVYDERKALYDAYVADKAAYDEAYAAYVQNRARQEAYNKALTAYYAYEAQRQQNAALYDRYEAYLRVMEQMESRVAVLNSLFIEDSHEWGFYYSLMGEIVTGVLEKRAELKSLRVSGEDIDGAKEATDALRELMQPYYDLWRAKYPSKFEKTVTLYGYYAEHYSELRTQIAKLFTHIHAIYNHGSVQTVMESNPQFKEQLPHFRQFLAQLYVVKCCLNDVETLDLSWTLPLNSEPLESIVESPLLLPDNDQADPAGIVPPTEEMTLDDSLLKPVEKPQKDFVEIEAPGLEPEAVNPPSTPPAEVADPGDAPAAVSEPVGDAPILTLTEAELLLASELESGTLPLRSPSASDRLLNLSQDVTATRSVRNRKTVTFYDWNGVPVSVREVDYGEEITDPPTLTRADAAYSYTFLGWIPYGSDADTPMSLAGITENLSLSPLFSRRAKIYTVEWIFEGRPDQTKQTTYWKYGETPICPVDPAWDGDVAATHTFLGWDREIEPVTENAVYTARYETAPAVYTITWDLGDRTETERLSYGATPVYQGSPTRAADGNVYAFRKWDRAIGQVKGDATYTAVWQKTPLIPNASDEACYADHTETTVTVYPQTDVFDLTVASDYARSNGKTLLLQRENLTLSFTPEALERLSGALCAQLEFVVKSSGSESVQFRIGCRNSLGKTVKTGLLFSVTVRYPQADSYTVAYRAEENGNWKEIDLKRYAGGRSTFTARENETVICRPEYRLQYTDETDNCNLTLLPAHAVKGTSVLLATDCAYGYEISGATLVFANGQSQEVGTTFTMPAERVRVDLRVTEIVYHITFVVDGEIVSEQTCRFGEEVQIPADPQKADSENARYLFTGWSPYVTRATGEDRNPIYTASFSETALSSEKTAKGYSIFETPLFFSAVGVVLLIAAAVVLIVFRKKIFRKKGKGISEPQ